MYGTLRRALSARRIEVDPAKYVAYVQGHIQKIGSTIRITEIAVHYDLTIPVGKRERVDRALKVHPAGCPAHESVKDAIKITWTANVTEE